jgi:hypothetical protein
VTPSDRVINFVSVRAAPSSQSAMLGKLLPGAQAEELESLSHWLKVRLTDGTVGYVSRAWVTEVAGGGAESTPTSAAGTPGTSPSIPSSAGAPVPLLARGHPVSWWFVFKFNAAAFAECSAGATRQCLFGGDVQNYSFGQQFVYASSEAAALQEGSGCVGDAETDPVGATFSQVYNGSFHYVVWNDQFYQHPVIPFPACSGNACLAPWGHSKGMVAWNDAGDGLVMQVTTPSWPAAGSVSPTTIAFSNAHVGTAESQTVTAIPWAASPTTTSS